MRPLALALAALALPLALGACGQKANEKSYTVTDPTTGEKGTITVGEKNGEQTVTMAGKEGSTTVVAGAGAAPTNLPDYVPLYPGATYQASMTAAPAGNEAGGAMTAFTTKDAPDKVIGFYREAFRKAGLKEAGAGNFGEMHMIAATKEGSETGAQVMATKGPDGETSVQVIYALQK